MRFLFLFHSFAAASDLPDFQNPLSKPAAIEIMTSLENQIFGNWVGHDAGANNNKLLENKNPFEQTQ